MGWVMKISQDLLYVIITVNGGSVCVCVYTLCTEGTVAYPLGSSQTYTWRTDILHVYKRDILMNVDVFTDAGRTDTVKTGEMTNSTRNAVFFVNR